VDVLPPLVLLGAAFGAVMPALMGQAMSGVAGLVAGFQAAYVVSAGFVLAAGVVAVYSQSRLLNVKYSSPETKRIAAVDTQNPD
jgi:hypothetical protein